MATQIHKRKLIRGKLRTLQKILESLKWSTFIACSALSVWKIVESIYTYNAQEVGTKVDVKFNQEVDLPSFAVCRHPNQIFQPFDSKGTLLEFYGLQSVSDARYLKFFEEIESKGYSVLEVSKDFAANNSKSVSSLVISSRGQYAGSATPSLISRPEKNNEEWSTFWSPIYGTCFQFTLVKNLTNYVGNAGVEFVKVNLNFEEAFSRIEAVQASFYEIRPDETAPTTQPRSRRSPQEVQSELSGNFSQDQEAVIEGDFADVNETFKVPEIFFLEGEDQLVRFSPDNFRVSFSLLSEQEPGNGELLIVGFESGRFFTSQETAIVTQTHNEYFTISQEIIDKADIKDIVNCTIYNDTLTEDDCLNDCLVQKFIEEFQCLHPRLAMIVHPSVTAAINQVPICQVEHLKKKTEEYHQRLTEAASDDNPVTPEEFGLVRIREILAGFQNTDIDHRCGCKLPCSRNFYTLQSWRSDLKSKSENLTNDDDGFGFFQFSPSVKVYTYFAIYTENDLVADIGGYLGLFLGLSVFSLFEFLALAVENLDERRQAKLKMKQQALQLDSGHVNNKSFV